MRGRSKRGCPRITALPAWVRLITTMHRSDACSDPPPHTHPLTGVLGMSGTPPASFPRAHTLTQHQQLPLAAALPAALTGVGDVGHAARLLLTQRADVHDCSIALRVTGGGRKEATGRVSWLSDVKAKHQQSVDVHKLQAHRRTHTPPNTEEGRHMETVQRTSDSTADSAAAGAMSPA